MSALRSVPARPIEYPQHAVRSECVEPILYLAERMAAYDPTTPPPPQPMVERLAELAGQRGFRGQASFRRLSEDTACALLITEWARKGALVAVSLVMKADTTAGPAARAHLTRLRERLGCAPIAVPAKLEEHLALALAYLRD